MQYIIKNQDIEKSQDSILRDKMLTLFGALITVISITSGIYFFVLSGIRLEYSQAFSPYILTGFVTGVTLVLIGELFLNKRRQSEAIDKRILNQFTDEISLLKSEIKSTLESYNDQIVNIQSNTTANIELNSEEKEKLFQNISKDIKASITENLIEEISDKQKDKVAYRDVLQFADGFRDRLMFEVRKLSGRANTNLFIGSITSIIGIAFLGFVLIGSGRYEIKLSAEGMSVQLAEYMLYYIPRLSLILLIEIFSYFFLRLYKNSLEDIKYYHNELTNVDSSISALRLALLIDCRETISKLITHLLKIERNFVLKKGDTTVQLEVAKAEAQKTSESLKMFENLFKQSKSLILPSRK